MPASMSLSERARRHLPGELVDFLRAAGAIAGYQGYRLYLVGGVVRDILLGRRSPDIDLVVEGDGPAIARQCAGITGGRLTVHSRFRTASLTWGGRRIDFATARSESYRRPGALPAVRAGTLADDLLRRDFTISAMAIDLNPGGCGRLADPHGGRKDLESGIVRILHRRSFADDATRIWRAVRYEQRLGFAIEGDTLGLLRRDVGMLDTISCDRIRREVQLTLREARPEKTLRRADELGVLAKLHPSLRGDEWLARMFSAARRASGPEEVPAELYWALLAYRLEADEIEQLIAHLRLPGRLAATLRDTARAREAATALPAGAEPSQVFAALHGLSLTAIAAVRVAAEPGAAGERARLYADELRHVRPRLTGADVQAMGIPAGPRVKDLLTRLRSARLDGEAASRRDEERLVREWLED